jgi:hypothetical protein
MSRYETFVVRLWVEDGGVVDHGEVRHLTTGTGLRFRDMDQALQFIQRMASRPDRDPSESEVDELPPLDDSHEATVIGFKPVPERGEHG